MTQRKQKKIMNGDITLAALRQCQRASKVISPFIIFAVFDVSLRHYKLLINYSFFYIYICCFITVVQMSIAGIFWSRNLCLSAILLRRTKFRVNQTVNCPDIAEKRFSLWRRPPRWICKIFNLENFQILKKNFLKSHSKRYGTIFRNCPKI